MRTIYSCKFYSEAAVEIPHLYYGGTSDLEKHLAFFHSEANEVTSLSEEDVQIEVEDQGCAFEINIADAPNGNQLLNIYGWDTTTKAWKVLDMANHKTAQELIRHLEALRNSRF